MFTLHRVLSVVVAVILISFCCWPFSRSTNRKQINKYAEPYTHAIISLGRHLCLWLDVWKVQKWQISTPIMNVTQIWLFSTSISTFAMDSFFSISLFPHHPYYGRDMRKFCSNTNQFEITKLFCIAILTSHAHCTLLFPSNSCVFVECVTFLTYNVGTNKPKFSWQMFSKTMRYFFSFGLIDKMPHEKSLGGIG